MDNNNSLIPLKDAVEAIKTAIMQGQYEALKDVNRVQLAVYYAIGKYLSKNTRRLAYGSGAIKSISDQLLKEMPGLRGFSATNLKNMRLFYEQWQILDVNSSDASDGLEEVENVVVKSSDASDDFVNEQTNNRLLPRAIANNSIDIYHTMTIPNVADFPVEDFFRVPFSHHIEIFKGAQTLSARYYYIHRTAEEHISFDKLKVLIKQQAYEHQDQLPNNFLQTIPNSAMARKAVMMFKDSYALSFINTEEIGERDKEDINERVVEQKIVHNVKNFIMTFGTDFTFVGNQYHLEIYGKEFFPDLIFFNRELNALVVVELKIGDFKPSYLGQLTAYLKILDTKVRKAHENPSIGIVLCKSANKDFVEFIIQEYDRPMGVATYTTAADMPDRLRKALPDENELRKLLESVKE